jgi:hypothetical protein
MDKNMRVIKALVASLSWGMLVHLLSPGYLAKGQGAADALYVQWEAPSEKRPLLRQVRIVPGDGTGMKVEAYHRPGSMPRGARITGRGSFRVELANDYGFTLSTELLRREPFVWLKDLGIFAAAGGDFEAKRAVVDALRVRIEAARNAPFQSTSEKWNRGGPFEFAYNRSRPVGMRVNDALFRLPEVDHRYFLDRVSDKPHRVTFLGWPNVAQEFFLLSNGTIGVSSRSSLGTGHPPAQDFSVELGSGRTPAFRPHGDPAVRQSLEDGYQLIVNTEWRGEDPAGQLFAKAFAYPMESEAVRTGNEPLAIFLRLRRSHAASGPFWLRIRASSWVREGFSRRQPVENPLKDLGAARIDRGRLIAGQRIVLAFTAAAGSFWLRPNEDDVLVRLEPEADVVDVVIPFVAVGDAAIAAALQRGFEPTLSRTREFWNQQLAQGTQIDAPDPIVNNLYKTGYPRIVISGDLDTDGTYALKTSPVHYEEVWLHNTARGAEALARRGHFEDAQRYLEAAFKWQGTPASEASETYRTWRGFFNASPRYMKRFIWLNFHGYTQWAAARYYLFSDDRRWLEEKLPALIDSLLWTASQREVTMRTNSDGTQPLNYGWLPPGRTTDSSSGTSTFTDCVNWRGFNEIVQVLERIHHPRAGEFRKIADGYRQDILRGLRRAAATREPVRLNDGTFVPYVPGHLESKGHEEDMWYAAVVDASLEGVLDSGILAAGDPMEQWILHNLEDNLLVYAPNLADESYYSGHLHTYLRRGTLPQAVYTFYSFLVLQMNRHTLTQFEHRSWGDHSIWGLIGPIANYTHVLSSLLCYDEAGELIYGHAMPKAWLDAGKQVRVDRLQTRFGPTSFIITAGKDMVRAQIEMPKRYRPGAAKLRIRVDGQIVGVRVNGRQAPFDQVEASVDLPWSSDRLDVEAQIVRSAREQVTR